MHIRRTDKINTEARLVKIEDYMKSVDDYFNIKALVKKSTKNVARVIYIATDDAKVIEEIKNK